MSGSSVRWIRNRATRRENTVAGVLATGIGMLTGATAFYVARLILARDPILREEDEEGTGDTVRQIESGD